MQHIGIFRHMEHGGHFIACFPRSSRISHGKGRLNRVRGEECIFAGRGLLKKINPEGVHRIRGRKHGIGFGVIGTQLRGGDGGEHHEQEGRFHERHHNE